MITFKDLGASYFSIEDYFKVQKEIEYYKKYKFSLIDFMASNYCKNTRNYNKSNIIDLNYQQIFSIQKEILDINEHIISLEQALNEVKSKFHLHLK